MKATEAMTWLRPALLVLLLALALTVPDVTWRSLSVALAVHLGATLPRPSSTPLTPDPQAHEQA